MPSPEGEDIYWNPDLGPAPFNRIMSGPIPCTICGGEFSSSFGWGCKGWMCSTWSCKTCGATHLVVDSKRFCDSCEYQSATCLYYPTIFIRSDDV